MRRRRRCVLSPRTWINDLKGRGIRVNVLSPGHIETPGLSVLMTDKEKASVVANVPLGRIGTPDDMAKSGGIPRLRRQQLCQWR
jgi:NAD(P)-dependent dehydrogenase (short-subunit alcohol dehydrogenase family)